jgi:hypothetical protein
METFYTAYTKLLDYKTYYFVKKFSSFPEFKDVSPILDAYGMHTNFDKACSIAGLTDPKIKQQLLQQAEEHSQRGKIVELGMSNYASHSIAG